MNTKTNLILAAAVLGAVGALMGGIVFQENFQNYNETVPGVNTNLSIWVDNDPIWARGANLELKPATNQTVDVYAKSITLPPGNKFDVHFRYRFHNGQAAKPEKPEKDGKPAEAAVPATPGAFDLVMRAADGREWRVRLASDGVAGQPLPWLDNRLWASFAIKVNGAKADIFQSHDRALRKIATVDVPITCASVNFGTVPGRIFALTDIVVQTPGALPSHPVEKHFASFKSLSQPIANAKTAAVDGEAVALMPSPRSGVRFSVGTTNASQNAALKVFWSAPSKPGANDRMEVFPLRVLSHHHTMKLPIGPYPRGKGVGLPDARIEFAHLFSQAVRPDLLMYAPSRDIEPQGVDIVREWNRLPPASRHPLDLDFAAVRGGGVQMWVDGSLERTFRRADAAVTNIVLCLPKGARYAVKEDLRAGVDTDRFTLVDFSANPRAKAFVDAKSTLEPGVRDFGGVPIAVAAPIDSGDVAICKQGKGNWALECDEYHGRSPMHGFPSAVHFRVPAAGYGRAHILFALDPDPRKEAFLTVRLGHYVGHGSGGNMLGDTIIDLRGGKSPEDLGFRQVGAVSRGGKEIPIYLASLDLNIGPILDLASGVRYDGFSGGYIDFEFTGKGWENYEQIDRSIKPDPNSDSAFNIFGATLEKLPVRIEFRQDQPGNLFTLDEKRRKTSFILTALRDKAKGRVSWTATDADGREVFTGSEKYAISKTGSSNIVEIALDKARDPGYYTLAVKFEDGATGCAFTHDAAFAVLPESGRQVDKWESPYAVWWFSAHGSPGNPAIGGPMMKKAGVVRASANGALKKEDYEKYNLTNYRIAYISLRSRDGGLAPGKVKEKDPNDPTGKRVIEKEYPGEVAAEMNLRKAVESNPKIDTVLLWHESGPGYGIPEELLGLPVTQEQLDADKWLAPVVDTAGRVVRKVSKETGRPLKLQIGNSNTSIGAALRPLRGGAKVSSYDQIGLEAASQVIPPERLSEVALQGMRIAYDAAAYYAEKQKLPPPALNGSWEFIYRCDRDMGERQQAEWYMRDVLISLANNFYYISPGILFDCKNGYYNDLWGGSGLIRRHPFCYPKQAFVAYGVLTKCLDGVKFVRQLDTGSTTVYAVEFKRLDGRTATALWAARGDVEFALEGVAGGTATHMLGHVEKLADGVATVRGGTSPTYVITDKPLERVSIVGRTFQKDGAIAARAVLAPAVSDTAFATLAPDPDLETRHHSFLPILKPSDFTLSAVDDEERGACLEVALDTSKNSGTSKYITEYTTVRFAKPIPLEGRPVLVGCWVKGNSNWGQIRFEIEDGNGEVFKNQTTGRSWGCDIMDWPGNLCVNFDGWNFVYAPLARNSLMNDHSPGPLSEQWVSEGGDKKIDYPVKVRAVTVGMNRTKLDLLDFKPSAPAIRLGAVGGVSE